MEGSLTQNERSDDVLRPQVLESLDRIDRGIDRGALMSWTQAIHVLALARWAVNNGFTGLDELDSLIDKNDQDDGVPAAT